MRESAGQWKCSRYPSQSRQVLVPTQVIAWGPHGGYYSASHLATRDFHLFEDGQADDKSVNPNATIQDFPWTAWAIS